MILLNTEGDWAHVLSVKSGGSDIEWFRLCLIVEYAMLCRDLRLIVWLFDCPGLCGTHAVGYIVSCSGQLT
jgi:hypothetical protein